MPNTVTILGSTGTIGLNTLDLIAANPDKFQIAALTTNTNVEALEEQVKKFKPKLVSIFDKSKYKKIQGVEVLAGEEGLIAAAEMGETVISAIVGFAALKPTMKAIQRGAKIGLANKESLVCAGKIMTDAAEKSGAKLIPIDSEHNAIFQVFDHINPANIEKITLTASGGPFRNLSFEQMKSVTPEQATKHPNWKMGAKISVDSATLMNKGLELIEAFHLFPIQENQLDVIVHPESVIHALVAYKDGSVLAQAAVPDMKVPISYALSYPERLTNNCKRLDLTEYKSLNFEKPDFVRFPCLKLAIEALKTGGYAPTILNAANEVAVTKFLNNEIKFTDIAVLVQNALENSSNSAINCIEDVLEIDRKCRELVKESARQAA